MNQRIIYLSTIMILLSYCTMKPDNKINTEEYQELHFYSGNQTYEIVELISKKNLVKYLQFDTIQNLLVLKSYFKCEDKTQNTYETLKIDIIGGKQIFDDIGRILKDGTMWNRQYYQNWIINGDVEKKEFFDPLTDDQKKKEKKWLELFDEIYMNSSLVYIYNSRYFFKNDDLWYKINDIHQIMSSEFLSKYPAKVNDSRMIELKDLCPSFGIALEKRDTSLTKEMKYESTFFEKSKRGRAFNFSAGWWYLDMYLPGGDTLKIKRYASYRNPALKVYKIPKEHGGRDDVLFIVQEPSEMLKEQVGGMYVIRPKNIK